MTRRHPNVVNADEVEPTPFPRRGIFAPDVRMLARAAGAEKLGCTMYELAPGCAAFPYHWHAANEEAIIVLSGEGSLRIGADEVAVRAGDYVAMLVGAAHAHQLRNTGSEVLRYYCISTRIDPEVAGYPDSKKIGILTQHGPEGMLRVVYRDEDGVGYFDREPLAGE